MANIAGSSAAVKPVPQHPSQPSRPSAGGARQATQPRQPGTSQRLSYGAGYVYRALWFSKFGGGRFPTAGTFRAGRLLMKVNAFRDQDGRRPIGPQHLRRTVSTLRDKGYLAFRSSRRRRRPAGDTFRRATFVECLVPIEAIRYLERGRERDQTHRLPRIQKCAFAATPQEMRVRGHEVTRAPLEVTRGDSQVVVRSEKTKSTERPPRPPRRFTQRHFEAERLLTAYAVQTSELLGQPWEPLQGKRPWRLGAIEKTTQDTHELVQLVVGMAVRRGADIEDASSRGRWHPFWEVGHGDIVARALALDPEEGAESEWRAILIESGQRFLGNVARSEELRREAAVGRCAWSGNRAWSDAS